MTKIAKEFRLALPSPTRRLLVAAGLIAALAGPALAAPPPAAPLTPQDQALVAKAGDYLANLAEVKGHFVQTDARGQTVQGELFIKRPGKARFAYDPPSSRLVVSDGFNVSIADPRLKTFDRYPLVSTPLALFLSRDVRTDKGVEIVRVDHFSDGFAITARDVKHRNAGSVTLTFAESPTRLRDWSLTDGQGQVTQMRINLQPTSGLDPALFVLRDPRAKAPTGGPP
jgi:outer membrane lipoprotein-sorting protein